MTTWLLLSLLTFQTVTGRGLHQRDFKNAQDTLQAELEDLVPKQLPPGKHLTVPSDFSRRFRHFLPSCTPAGNIQDPRKRMAVCQENLSRHQCPSVPKVNTIHIIGLVCCRCIFYFYYGIHVGLLYPSVFLF